MDAPTAGFTDRQSHDLSDASGVVLLQGYLGTGKSTLARALTGCGDDESEIGFQPRCMGRFEGDQGLAVVEAGSVGSAPIAEDLPARVIAVIDAINGLDLLHDAHVGPSLRADIAAAGLVVVTCGDLTDPGPLISALQDLTGAPVLDRHSAKDLPERILALTQRQMPPVARPKVAEWRYEGSAVLTAAAVEAFLTARPAGAYRVKGAVQLPDGGGRIDVFGRGKRMPAIDPPGETCLAIAGPTPLLDRRQIDIAFAEAVAASSYGRGMIACR